MGARGEMDDLELSAGVCTDPIQSKAKTTLTTSSWDAGDREPFPKKKPTPATNPNLRVELRLLTPKGRFFGQDRCLRTPGREPTRPKTTRAVTSFGRP